MEPHIEHTFYTWIIVMGAVAVAAWIGSMIDRVRALKARRVAVRAISRSKKGA